MDMDFTTFPATSTTAAATTTTTTMTTPEPPAVVAGPLPASACRQLPFYRFAASSSSPPPWLLLPSSPSPTAATGAPPVTTSRAPTTMAAQQGPPGAGGDAAAAAAVAEVEDRMDLLWEDFNEELALARGGSRRARAGGGLQHARDLWSSGSSDAEWSEPAAARGCAPVLRPSSRAGGAVRHCRRRAGTWVMLMRIFRRLFVIEKTVSASAASARRHHAAATPRAS